MSIIRISFSHKKNQLNISKQSNKLTNIKQNVTDYYKMYIVIGYIYVYNIKVLCHNFENVK